MSLQDSIGNGWHPHRCKGIVRRVSENPVDYAVLDVEAATIYGMDVEEVQDLMLLLQCTSEAQYMMHPKDYPNL